MSCVPINEPKPALKTWPYDQLSWLEDSIQRNSPCQHQNLSCPSQLLQCTQGHGAQENPTQQQWQVVRKKRWWRREKKGVNAQYLTGSPLRSQKFKHLARIRCYNCMATVHQAQQCRDPPRCWKCMRYGLMLKRKEKFKRLILGKCFNCLDRDHMVASCRNPTKCWFCYKPGHVGAGCKSRHTKISVALVNSQSRAQVKPSSSPLFFLAQERSCLAMERRSSLGCASGGSHHRRRHVSP
jgi:hypothetical protein